MSHFLWAAGKNVAAYSPGSSLTDRYQCMGAQIFLDQKSDPPDNFDEVPEPFLPYLRLSPYQLHIPQIYDWVQRSADPGDVILLLEQVPLCVPHALKQRGVLLPQSNAPPAEVQLLPSLAEVWQTASPMRQLHWLWQIAQLWEPLNQERVASSLLDADLLRVEGPLLRLRELNLALKALPLSALGEVWLQQFVSTAKPAIQAPLQQLCQQLIQGQIPNAEALTQALDHSIAAVQGGTQQAPLHLATLTDQGPSRQRNEDACYPASGSVTSAPPATPLVIVCDGIGGHQGGDVASNLAIQSIEHQVLALNPDRLDPIHLSLALDKAVRVANDQISQKNDSEQRLERQRMGTTVVMGLVRAHELYLTHVGDSRAYWITRWGCHQVTQDDDVASREVRLGYSTYPQALQQPSSGSLVQALGMGNSQNLYPTVQRFLLDEECVFLFCSDGLSDNDQVERHWEQVFLPLFQGKTDLKTVSQQLVEIANSQNGYDNATVGIIHYRASSAKATTGFSSASAVATAPSPASTLIQPAEVPPTQPPKTRSGTVILAPGVAPQATLQSAPPAVSSTLKTEQFPVPHSSKQNWLPLILGILGLVGVAGVITFLLFPERFSLPERGQPSPSPSPAATEPASPEASPLDVSKSPTRSAANSASFVPQTLIQTRGVIVVQTVPPGLPPKPEHFAQIQPGSLIYILDRQPESAANPWIRFTLCPTSVGEAATSPGATPSDSQTPEETATVADALPSVEPMVEAEAGGGHPLLQPERIAWIRAEALAKEVDAVSTPDIGIDTQAGCGLGTPEVPAE